jgi:6,7-dimethyl-8-ribityllumazine synthase
MNDIELIEGDLSGKNLRFALVASRFNSRIVDQLVAGAVDCLKRHGVESTALTLVRVPGAWELPFALDRLAARGDFDGLVALGVVIRGETPHFDYVCSGATHGIARVSAEHGVPVGFGLLTCDTTAQAEARAGGKAGNKGWDAALAALEMASLAANDANDADDVSGSADPT